jgi:serine/threonine protein kinase
MAHGNFLARISQQTARDRKELFGKSMIGDCAMARQLCTFQIIGTIASGAFGKVYRVCLRSEPSAIFAMKVQNKSQVIAKEAIQQIKDEVTIHVCPTSAGL